MSGISSRRLEASTFNWSALTEKQKEAVAHVSRMMLDALKGIEESKKKKSETGLRSIRRSQLAFVDGDRGTGKTSVMLTVRDFTLGKVEEEDNRFPEIKELNLKRHHFHWLETLDMEPLRRDANLFAAILARIEAISGGQSMNRSALSSALDESEERDRVQSDLNALQNDAVMAWDRNSSKRGEHLDPHAYAAEVLRTERAGLQFNERLGNVLDGLAGLFKGPRNSEEPLFILPVDDFDLAPSRCLEMLRLIRAISTPRLFFLICGNSRIAQTILILQNEGELGSLVTGISQRDYEWQELIRPAGIEIAANNLRKLLPPEQRAVLPRINLEDALKLQLDRDNKTLADTLKAVTFDVNSNPLKAQETSLWSFLLLDERWPITSYSAAEFLGGTPRQVHDFAMWLDRFAGHQGGYGVAFLSALSAAIQSVINEEWSMSVLDRQHLEEATRRSFDGTFHLLEELQTRYSFRTWRKEQSVDWNARVCFSRASFSEFEILFKRQEDKRRNAAPRIPRRISAAVILLHDVAMSLWGANISGGSLLPKSPQPHLGELSETWIATSYQFPNAVLNLPWPTPIWTTFRQVECFNSLWTRLSQTCKHDQLAIGWIEAILRTIFDDPEIKREQVPSWPYIYKQIKRLVDESPEREIRALLRRTVLSAIIGICSPEYQAVDVNDVETLIKKCPGFIDENSDPEVQSRVREIRGKSWDAVNTTEDDGVSAFNVWCYVNPEFARLKFQLISERSITPYPNSRNSLKEKDMLKLKDLINPILDHSEKHPVNRIAYMRPLSQEISDRDVHKS